MKEKFMTSRFFTVVIIAFVAACLVTTDAMALKTWEAGVKAGWQGAKLRGDQIGLFISQPPMIDVRGPIGDTKSGFAGGGFIRRNFNTMFGLQLEALYSQKGGKGAVTGTVEYTADNNETYPGTIDGELTISLDYVEFPVLAVFSFEADEKFALIAELGLSFAFNTNADLALKGEASFDQPNFSTTIKDFEQSANVGGHINNFDLGGIVGAGVEVAVSDYMLYFDARYTFGLTSIDENGDKSVHNDVISVFAGFGIPFGGDMD
jgi:hypothetical protein